MTDTTFPSISVPVPQPYAIVDASRSRRDGTDEAHGPPANSTNSSAGSQPHSAQAGTVEPDDADGIEQITDKAVDALIGMRLARRDGDDVVALPAAGRFSLTPATPGADHPWPSPSLGAVMTLFETNFPPSATSSTTGTAHLPSPTKARFVPLRAGVLNVWEYDDQQFWFADGRLLLRGRNEAGKSKVLELLFPFVLDGDTVRRSSTRSTRRTSRCGGT